jgi:meso-butanediol dehydrogenase/(S,S)-butanediol dehydrogenase/diacetyl reductase
VEAWAVITGAASGIGCATVAAALARGYRVVAADRDEEGLQREFGDDPAVRAVPCDVTDSASVGSAFDAVDGEPSLVVNSAGIPDRTLLTDMSDETWARVLDINLGGTMRVDREALRRMTGGLVVNVASIAGHRSFAGRAAYSSSKRAVLALTEVAALEGVVRGVRVVAVSPGFVSTAMATPVPGFITDDAILGRTPAGRLATPEEIGAAIVALAAPEFAFMTGSALVIDGGWVANGGFWPMAALEERRPGASSS